MTESNVIFQGPGPFSIGVAQSVSAVALTDTVLVTMRMIVGDDPEPRPVSVQMVPKVANKLVLDIAGATISIQERGGKPANN